uniref:Calcium homeostasis modulator 3 n=1 Tax=Chrysemys picta bellii TaxID=8478 RepID=A0A8C3IJX3_CHRPI
MDRFRMIFQYFQSNSESVMNGICGLLALASVKMYTSFDFNCPCLPKYNMAYGLGIMFLPPTALFLCGLILNRQSLVMLEEWKRPTGGRKKDLAVIRPYTIRQRWEITARGPHLPLAPPPQPQLAVPPALWAAWRRGWLQPSGALGWSVLLILIVVACLARSLRPCFNQAAFLQTRYWSNYIDIEQKIFDETCCEHARDFAHKCILHFFESMQQEIKLRRFNAPREEVDGGEGEEDHLRGITDQEQMNELLKSWYYSKPPLDVSQATQRQQSVGRERLSVPWADSLSNRGNAPQKPKTSRQTDV